MKEREAKREQRAAIVAAGLFAAVLVSGCASTKVSDGRRVATGPIARPSTIWVYDFAASASAVPAESGLRSQFDVGASTQSAEQLATGRQLGAAIARELVTSIRAMGMPAQGASGASLVSINDVMIRGYLVSVEEGSGSKRVVIGLGSGGTGLETVAEGYQMTPAGPRLLGSRTVESRGAKTPGSAMGVASWVAMGNPAGLIVGSSLKAYGELSGKEKMEGRAKATADELARVLEQRFREEGWIR